MAEAVEDVEAVRRYLSPDRVVVAGHPMFGHLALAYAVACPQVVDGVVLIGVGPRASGIEAAVEADWGSGASDDRKLDWKDDRERVARELLSTEPNIDTPVLVATGRFDFVAPPVLWHATAERLRRATFVTPARRALRSASAPACRPPSAWT